METVRLPDPRVAVAPDSIRDHVVRSGASRVTERVEPAQSFSTQLINWSFQPPSTSTIISRDWKIRIPMRFVATGGPFMIGLADSPASFPLSSIIESIAVTINGNITTVQLGDIAAALRTMHNTPEDRRKYWSTTTAQPDSFQQFGDWTTFGSARNPLAGYGENSAEPTRGGFPFVLNAPNDVTYTFTEPILVDPLLALSGQDEGFVNVNQFLVTIQLKNNLSLAWSTDSVTNPLITSVAVSFPSPPAIVFRQFTPGQLQKIPPRQILPFSNPQIYRKNLTPALAPGASLSLFASDSIKLSMVPRRALVWAQRTSPTRNFNTTQNFLGISQISLQWDNQAALLSVATEEQLWEMSQKNGSNLSWHDWHKYRGACAIIDFGEDVGLGDDLAPGTQGQFSAQFLVTLTNLNSAPIDAELFIVWINEGTLTVVPNGSVSNLGNLTREIVLASIESPPIHPSAHEQLAGGSLWTGVKNLVRNVAKELAPFAPILGLAAGAAGLGGLAKGIGAASAIQRAVDSAAQANLSRGAHIIQEMQPKAYPVVPAGGRLVGGRGVGGHMDGMYALGEPMESYAGGRSQVRQPQGRLQRRYVH